MCDYAFLINSFLLYTTIKKVVLSIDYDLESNKFKIVQFKGRFLGKETSEMDPNDIVKCKGQTFNRLVGYRSLINAKAGRSMVCAAGNSGDWPTQQQNHTPKSWDLWFDHHRLQWL